MFQYQCGMPKEFQYKQRPPQDRKEFERRYDKWVNRKLDELIVEAKFRTRVDWKKKAEEKRPLLKD